MKQVLQLDNLGYVVGFTTADEDPLAPGSYLMPRNTIDQELPVYNKEETIGKRLRWIDPGQFILEPIPVPEPEPEKAVPNPTYRDLRALEYPPMEDYLDGIVKGDQAQIDKYIADCLAVKAKYPKPE